MDVFCAQCKSHFNVSKYESPVPKHLLETNDPPLLSEQPSLSDMLKGTEDEFSQITATITHLEKLLDGLRDRKNGMEHSLMVNKGVLSPMRRLPREVLADIFTKACALSCRYPLAASVFGKDERPNPVSLDTRVDIWPLARVCRIWRETALSMFSVWSNIGISYTASGPGSPDNILRAIISRANGHSICMDIDIAIDTAKSRALLDAAIEHSTLWREISITVPSKLLTKLRKLKGKLPLLETLSLSHRNSNRSLTISNIGEAFSVVPALHSATFRYFCGVAQQNFPWLQFTHFGNLISTSYGDSKADTLALLHKLPNLRSLTLSDDDWHRKPSSAHLTLLKLRSLRLSDYGVDTLNYLTLPALEVVTNVGVDHTGTLAALIRRSGCSIKTIQIELEELDDYDSDDENHTTTLFQEAPNLTELHISDFSACWDAVFGFLLAVLKDSEVLARIQTLQIPLSSLLHCPHLAEQLISLLCSRKKPLQEVILVVDRYYREDAGLDDSDGEEQAGEPEFRVRAEQSFRRFMDTFSKKIRVRLRDITMVKY